MKMNLYISFLCIALALFTTISLLAQTSPPEGILYQAEARDNTGKLLTNKVLEVKLIIKQESPTTGLTVWEGEYTVNTDKYGLFSLIMGAGETSGYVFSDIEWALYEHFLTVQLMVDGIWETTGSLQFLSVPYAMHSGTAQSAMSADEVDWDDVNNIPAGFADNKDDVIDDDPDPNNEIQTLNLTDANLTISGEGGNTVTFTNWDTDASNDVITTSDQIIEGNKTFLGTTTVNYPSNSTDAASKSYVDNVTDKMLSDYQVRSLTFGAYLDSWWTTWYEVSCPAGTYAIGGGVRNRNIPGSRNVTIVSSYSTGTGWRIDWVNQGTTYAHVYCDVQVICAKVD